MNDPRILQSNESIRSKRGPKPFYGEATEKRLVYYPPALLARLREEAAWRNARAGNPDTWSVSRVVVADLAKLYGIELQTTNGHQETP